VVEEIALPFERGENGDAASASPDSPADARHDTGADAPHDAAVRDAQAIAARVAADERAADLERERLTGEPLPALAAPEEPGLQLSPGEILHAMRRAANVEHEGGQPPSGGTLYLTSRRFVHVGAQGTIEIELEQINDLAVTMERLLLIELRDGSDLAIEVDQPRLLRVQLAAARAAARGRTTSERPQ